MIRSIIQCVWLGIVSGAALAADTNAPAPGVRLETFSGWENSLVLSGGDSKVVVLPAVGGRIAVYALNGDNILYDEPGSKGKTLAGTPQGFAMGGYYCDLGPESRSLPEHNLLGLGAWRWKAPRPQVVALESEPDPAVGVQMSREITMDPDSGEVGLRQRITNVSKAEVVLSLWDRTVCKGGGFALLPLSKKSRFKAGWAMARRDAAGKTYFDGSQPADRRVRLLDRILVVEAKGAPLKIGADSDQEWVAYTVGRLLLVKYFPCFPRSQYADGGNSVELACDEQRAELQPLSPELRVPPGGSQTFPEKWALYDLPASADTFAEARALVKRIPPSPFKK